MIGFADISHPSRVSMYQEEEVSSINAQEALHVLFLFYFFLLLTDLNCQAII